MKHSFRDLPAKVTILIARLSYNGYERVEIANWLTQTALALHEHPRVANVFHKILTGYPTPRVRNEVLKLCREKRIDFAVMLDDDVVPDVHSPNAAIGYEHLAKTADQVNFFPAALDFALEHPGPCVIGAPYCAGPPEERVLVSRFREKVSGDPNSPVGGLALECFSRDDAATRTGLEMVSSLPTGLILIDMRALDVLGAPWFDYEYEDIHRTKLASTEDTVFTRNLLYLGVPQYCAFQSWAAHVKVKIVGRPLKYPIAAVPEQVYGAVRDHVIREQQTARPPDRTNLTARTILIQLDEDADPVQPLADAEDAAAGVMGGLADAVLIETAESLGVPPSVLAEPITLEFRPGIFTPPPEPPAAGDPTCVRPPCDEPGACAKLRRCEQD